MDSLNVSTCQIVSEFAPLLAENASSDQVAHPRHCVSVLCLLNLEVESKEVGEVAEETK